MAPVVSALNDAEGLQSVVVHSGQHQELMQPVIELFDIAVDEQLDVMRANQSLAELTSLLVESIDAVLRRQNPERQSRPEVRRQIDASLATCLGDAWRERTFVLVTGHRRENFGEGFEQICTALEQLSRRFPAVHVIYPVHLNPNVRSVFHRRLGERPNIHLKSPQPYSESVALVNAARLLLTDSGGVQEEGPTLGKPVLVMRDTTERPEGVAAGAVKLVGTDPERIVQEVGNLLSDEAAYRYMARVANPYGDG